MPARSLDDHYDFSALLEIEGETVDLVAPEVISAEQAFALRPVGLKRPPKLLRIDEFLKMRRADDAQQ